MNTNLSLYFLFLGTSPLTVVSTTGHGKELIEKAQGRKGEQEDQFELISKVNMFSVFSYTRSSEQITKFVEFRLHYFCTILYDVKCKEVCFWD